MNETAVLAVGREAVYTLLTILIPILLPALVLGLIVSLFQSITQLQEMTLTFAPKIIAVFLALLFLFPFIVAQLRQLADGIFDRIVALG